MRPRFILDVNEAMAGGTIAVLLGVWFFALLMVAAMAPSVSAGLPGADRGLDRIDTALTRAGNAYAYQPGALCRIPPPAAQASLRQKLYAAAAANGIALTSLGMSQGARDAAAGGLTPVSLQLAASGPYNAMIGFLSALTTAQPEIFLTTVDLRSKTSAVALTLNGRFYCSTFARP